MNKEIKKRVKFFIPKNVVPFNSTIHDGVVELSKKGYAPYGYIPVYTDLKSYELAFPDKEYWGLDDALQDVEHIDL